MLGVLGIFKARGTKVFNEWIGKTSQIAGGSLTSMLAIKCILGTQVYGPFLLNMALPFIIAILLFIVIIPTTFFRRLWEKRRRHRINEMRERREAFALAPDAREDILRPKWEPIVDFGGLCCGIPRKTELALPCCRKAAGEEYIRNRVRKKQGRPALAPEYRALLPIDTFVWMGIPHACLLSCKYCRVATTAAEKGAWRATNAVMRQRVPFKPGRRFVAVMVLLMYSLYPTLVASTASIFNCTDKIYGKQYLMADLTVTCYEGWHVWYLAGAGISVIVYCIGTPVRYSCSSSAPQSQQLCT